MNARTAGLAGLFVCSCLLAVACGGSSAGVGDTPGAGEVQDLDAVYARIENALNDAYRELGNPSLNWDNVEKAKDLAFQELTSDSSWTPAGCSWSVSVMPDHGVVYVNVDGAEKSGEWRP